ncbi:lipopolysaccharide biosynthesis protein [Oleiphilus messinensis]|uniref:Lipopolysaccharide biosynthesis protein n=1 Tax=Oleiphilus messinensis TaxID=141451 RepID=A0A1Y0IGF9_9GAMM|nr:GNVR domain-containing protein [Oleiphilus messinensis]ARU59558.1 lipopolysaccharide biosynthesis protein [Oleiphilus messinensis]
MQIDSQNGTTFLVKEEINLWYLILLLWRHKIQIAIVTTIFAIGSVWFALRTPDIYLADVTVATVGSDGRSARAPLGRLGELASLTGISLPSAENTATNIAMIQSRIFMMSFIDENNLLPILYEKSWDKETKEWSLKDGQKPPSLQKAFKKFSGLIEIIHDRKTGLVTLNVRWYNPELAAEWANKIITKANSYLREKAINEAQESIEFLKKQISETNEIVLQNQMYALLQKELQTVKLASVRKDFAFNVIDPAIVPEVKNAPKRSSICILGTIIGAIFGAITVLIRHFTRRT